RRRGGAAVRRERAGIGRHRKRDEISAQDSGFHPSAVFSGIARREDSRALSADEGGGGRFLRFPAKRRGRVGHPGGRRYGTRRSGSAGGFHGEGRDLIPSGERS